jgi:hypothetical protein
VVRTLAKNAWARDTPDLLSAQSEGRRRQRTSDNTKEQAKRLIRDADGRSASQIFLLLNAKTQIVSQSSKETVIVNVFSQINSVHILFQ